eukprot:364550-Chlamydomonas_euryale.AAC.10
MHRVALWVGPLGDHTGALHSTDEAGGSKGMQTCTLGDTDAGNAQRSRAECSRAECSRAECSRAEFSRAECSRAECSRAECSRAECSRATRSRATRSRAECSRACAHEQGRERESKAGSESTGRQGATVRGGREGQALASWQQASAAVGMQLWRADLATLHQPVGEAQPTDGTHLAPAARHLPAVRAPQTAARPRASPPAAPPRRRCAHRMRPGVGPGAREHAIVCVCGGLPDPLDRAMLEHAIDAKRPSINNVQVHETFM